MSGRNASVRVILTANRPAMPNPAAQPTIEIRDIETHAEVGSVLQLEKLVWGLSEADVTPFTLAIALKSAGSILVGAFDNRKLIGFALAFPSIEHGTSCFHSHMCAVHPDYRDHAIGYRLKLAQRDRALAVGIKEMTWTFDPLRSTNAHLNFSKLGVISDSYRVDFYGPQTSSHLHTNGTDRLWVTWQMAEKRVFERVNGKNSMAEVVDALRHVEPLVRFNGNGRPVQGDLKAGLSRQRIAIEIPGDMDRIEHKDRDLAHEWRLATRTVFTESLEAGFQVKEFCRSIRGQQGPGAYLLEKRQD